MTVAILLNLFESFRFKSAAKANQGQVGMMGCVGVITNIKHDTAIYSELSNCNLG
jgi:hypothetical protein